MARTSVKYTANPFDAAIQLQTLYKVAPGEDAIIDEVAKSYVQRFERSLRAAEVDLDYYEAALRRCLQENLVH